MSNKGKDAEENTSAPKSGRKKKIILMVVAALLLAGGGVGAKMMLGEHSSEESPPQPGAVLALDAVTVNLSDGHYLRMRLALQATTDVGEETPDGSKALDLAISQYSQRGMAELSTASGRAKAKQKLIDAVEQAYEGEIMDIYFTEFVMQ